jgi:hypothetical protein
MRLYVFFFLLLATGCATARPVAELRGVDFGTRPRAITLRVPFVEQTPLLCGPTALWMVLRANQVRVPLEEVTKTVYTPDARGTYKQDLLAGARRFGLAPYPVDSPYEMIYHLARGRPVVVFHSTGFLWKNFWHYSVLTGYDLARETFTIHIGPFENKELPMADVLRSWMEGGRWSYVLLKPGQIAEFARPEEAVDNALVFLRIGFTGAAERLAEAASARWPGDSRPEILLADALAHRGFPALARAHLRRALARDPGNVALKSKVAGLGRE